ncbi:membrane protein [Gluconacetobacter liquefaciens]|uniref:Chemotaxis protein MotB n=1 Tax=Gluconacetobacter liquefaciens TaxID=89584 RepID=A0A370GC23_GLULI|nr:flagellar motor protein MotB [Gluconacetobacter liquefaciens]MBB2185727.1 OmpA family protein [Gluconacetobacter liquefaciens]RDI39533.1 chemotaxis protein MotB [Gluconacetobacter liquefaciens]GBQ95939.1 flagellar motor protein MotB [Gluconacetobacter liquefaciens NRIC 0522]GEB36172.1 membrane protein [Gluconacetobacter liquefaciens]
MARNNKPPVIIRRSGESSDEPGHHGGAWKIAYADFMTAMMAFFLVMWLLNATTDEQRRGIAQFFNPMADNKTLVPPTDGVLDSSPSPLTAGKSLQMIKNDTSSNAPQSRKLGAGRGPITSIEGGAPDDITYGIRTAFVPRTPSVVPIGGPDSGGAQHTAYVGADDAAAEQGKIEQMASNLQQAIQKDPTLHDATSNVAVSFGRNDIRIELRDASNTPMFDSGSPAPNSKGRQMLAEIAKWLAPMPERISIIGYTDSDMYRPGKNWSMSNWTLSALRADYAREALVKAGYPDTNILDVSGRADRSLAVPATPSAPANRRVVIVMHKMYGDGAPPVLPLSDNPAAVSPGPEGTAVKQHASEAAKPK